MDEKVRAELDELGRVLDSNNEVMRQMLGRTFALDTGLQVICRSWGRSAEDVMALLKSELDAGAKEIRARGADAITVRSFNALATSLMNALQTAAKNERSG
ncbi:hypothetical protein D7U87_15500 [Stenotrophomonas maltophilia]|nr:hypothetical protein [Stenotrophomonas maltophilia]